MNNRTETARQLARAVARAHMRFVVMSNLAASQKGNCVPHWPKQTERWHLRAAHDAGRILYEEHC